MNSSPNPTDEELYLLLTIIQFVPTKKKNQKRYSIFINKFSQKTNKQKTCSDIWKYHSYLSVCANNKGLD